MNMQLFEYNRYSEWEFDLHLLARGCSVGRSFTVEIIIQCCKQNPGFVHSGSECVLLAGVHQNMVLEWFQMCCWSGWMKREIIPRHKHPHDLHICEICLFVISPHFTWSADICGRLSASACWGWHLLAFCGILSPCQSTVFSAHLQDGHDDSLLFPRYDCCRHDAELQSKVPEQSKTNKHNKIIMSKVAYLNPVTYWIKKKKQLLTKNCSYVSAVLQDHQKWLTISLNQWRRRFCPFTFPAFRR